jgi:hypothetical protein
MTSFLLFPGQKKTQKKQKVALKTTPPPFFFSLPLGKAVAAL